MTSATVLTHPRFAPTHRTVRLLNLNGDTVFTAGFTGCGDTWAWIQETVAHELGCNEDDVSCQETDDGDMVTVEGLPVYMIKFGVDNFH